MTRFPKIRLARGLAAGLAAAVVATACVSTPPAKAPEAPAVEHTDAATLKAIDTALAGAHRAPRQPRA